MDIMKRTDEIKVDTEEEAMKLIESFKEKAKTDGYEIVSHTATLKEKKSKGEVIDSYYLVKIVMRWS